MYWLPLFALHDMMLTPGAEISGFIRLSWVGPRLENEARPNPPWAGSDMAATVSAPLAAPGDPIVYLAGPELPAAITGTIPASAARLTAWETTSVPSEELDVPRLMEMSGVITTILLQ